MDVLWDVFIFYSVQDQPLDPIRLTKCQCLELLDDAGLLDPRMGLLKKGKTVAPKLAMSFFNAASMSAGGLFYTNGRQNKI